jgi:protein-S-isoprenylcysteine O-methyltransferase Ste14
VRLGGWLFRQRTWIPLPLVAALALVPPGSTLPPPILWGAGAALVAAGEWLRLWAVRHIGVISRTRSDRLGPLVATGPFSFVRNPLYLGNILIWAGFAVTARALWLALVIVVLLGIEYHAIVRWEEGLLGARLDDSYREYVSHVPRWLPAFSRPVHTAAAAPFSWRATIFSERGTLMAIAAGYALLYLKFKVKS